MNNRLLHSDKLTLLVIDDNATDRQAVQRILAPHYRLIEADSESAASVLLESETIGCVLLDYKIPGTDSLALLDTCIQLQLAVVMLTGAGDESIAVDAMKRGASDYLRKDRMTPEALQRSVSNAIEKNTLKRLLQEKQQELEDFASIAAHDLKSPLRTVISHCQLVQMDADDALPLESKDSLQIAITSAMHLADLVEALLEYTRSGRSAMALEPVDLQAVIADVLSSLDSAIQEANAQVEIGSLPKVEGDITALRQLLQNLVTNALKFRGASPPRVQVTASLHETEWLIKVADNGIGIEPEYHHQIFKPLQRLHDKSAYEGSGIGLAVCMKIVRQHGGNIWVESQPGAGSVFTILLPAPVVCMGTGDIL